jgi:uncharacterized cofD-like protein
MTRRPKVVAIGGGRGLSVTVRAVRTYAGHTTAIVATADDSGSSGRLRSSSTLPALGDLRRCVVAMADADDKPLGRAFEYRFTGTDVEGHALGNLLVAALAAVSGDLLAATEEASRLLGADLATARVIPATTDPVDLRATTAGGGTVEGQYAISQTKGIERIALRPADVEAADGVVAAIRNADQVVLGPGSLYTSILAAALVPAIHAALAATTAARVYVCNLEPEDYETWGYDVATHLSALDAHGVGVDVAVADQDDTLRLGDTTTRVVRADLAVPNRSAHDTGKLAHVLADLVPR